MATPELNSIILQAILLVSFFAVYVLILLCCRECVNMWRTDHLQELLQEEEEELRGVRNIDV